VRVIGDDVYGLDADPDGIGCEAGAASSQAAAPKTSSRPVEAPFTTRAASPTTTRLAPTSRNPTSQFAPD
jgi:hypothetical protein